MRIKEGFELRDIAGQQVVQAFGLENIDYSKLIILNETAAYLWRELEGRDFTETDCVELLRKEYDVPPTILADVRRIISSWREEGLIAD